MTRITQSTVVQGLAILGLAIGLAATASALMRWNGFWEDELFPLAVRNVDFPEFFIAIPRLDMHPPVHYLQFKLWGALFSSDMAAVLNSVVWHLVSCCVIFAVGRAWRGTTVGLSAVALYVLVPQVIWASVTLRAYAMIPGLAVAAWWLNVRALSLERATIWQWVVVAAIELALGYSHPIGFYFAAWIALAAATQARERAIGKRVWIEWLSLQTVVGILLLPLPISALVRGTEGATTDVAAANLLFNLGAMVAGWGMKSSAGLALGATLYIAGVVLGLRAKVTRPVTVWILIVPFALAMLVSLTFAPMFKTPVYSAMLVPFLCLTLAASCSTLGRWKVPVLVVMFAFLAAAAVPASRTLLNKDSPWKSVAEDLKRRVQPGDVVVIPKPHAYWAILRYVAGPDWGSPLDVLPSQSDSRWEKVTRRLGPELSSTLHLIPKSNHITYQGVTYVIGGYAVAETQAVGRVWVIDLLRYPIPVNLSDGLVELEQVAEYGDEDVVRIGLRTRGPTR